MHISQENISYTSHFQTSLGHSFFSGMGCKMSVVPTALGKNWMDIQIPPTHSLKLMSELMFAH